MFSVLTINAALQDVRLLSRSLYRPVGYINERLSVLAAEIRKLNPDIVCIQELFHHDLQQQFYSWLHAQYSHAAGFAKKGFKLRLGNELILLSRFPLTGGKHMRFRHASLEERLFTSKGSYRVFVTIPGVGEIQLINFHLTAGGIRQHPEHPVMENIRSLQIQQLLSMLSPGIPVILAGDLNAGPDVSIVNYEQILKAGFIDAFAESGGTGITWDPANPLVANHGENNLPPQRIDHIFLNSMAAKILKPDTGRVVLNALGIHLKDNHLIPVSDHYGIQVDFRINNKI